MALISNNHDVPSIDRLSLYHFLLSVPEGEYTEALTSLIKSCKKITPPKINGDGCDGCSEIRYSNEIDLGLLNKISPDEIKLLKSYFKIEKFSFFYNQNGLVQTGSL